ncbi:tol protein-like protein [Colletotrichum plurivorum]|uniref:Tol protein-like protein n=1 Tax=Colletotrichum plurivorum TaxID=2175906 RepID=A0A8H6K0L8_9PEZI|nr:tol protein-like protein [Colletotrichum plurivorum]
MAPDSTLCEYCSHINFDLLRHPTAAEIQCMNAGDRPSGDRFPLKHNDTTGQVAPMWSLGFLSRIRKSAASCSFFKAVVTVLQEQRHQLAGLVAEGVDDPFCIAVCGVAGTLMPPEGIAWNSVRSEEGGDVFHLRRLELGFQPAASDSVGPGMVGTIHRWKRLVECFQTYHPESDIGFSKMENIFGEAEDADTVLFAGRKRPAKVRTGLPAQWLKLSIVDFKDVDLTQLKYTALSYVWGIAPQKLVLRKFNCDELHQSRSLQGRVSQTIEDAFQFTRSLGIQYIWVDAICIIQDSDEDKGVQIGKMASIYACSLLTIIAAGSGDAHAGLPGISRPRGGSQETVTIRKPGSMEEISLLTALKPPDKDFAAHPTAGTTWSTRGWTLQERALTRRAVIFLEEQLLWACCIAQFSEETSSEAPIARVTWNSLQQSEYYLNSGFQNLMGSDSENDQMWLRLSQLVLDYTQRNLTVQGDSYDAFSAILQQAQDLSGEQFLCTGLTTREVTFLKRKRKVPFPSWSWVGWQGAVGLTIKDDHVETGLEPVILAYVFRNTPPRVVQVRRLFMDDPGRKWQPLAAAMKGTLAVSMDDCPKALTDRLADTPDDQLLLFWAGTARFKVTEPVKSGIWGSEHSPFLRDRWTRYRQNIIGAEGEVVGQTGVSKESHDAGAIAIAKRTPPPDYNKTTRIVLQVERRPDGVAYRINIAEICQDA